MHTILALDQGTTGSTALVISESGQIVSRAYQEFTQHFPRPGWVEHDPNEIWAVTLDVARRAMAGADGTPAAIGITNQRETVVCWDRRTGEPLHHALVWQDRRTADRCRELQAERGDAYIYDKTGLVWDPYFSGTKIEWLLQQPEIKDRAAESVVFGTIDSWLVNKLTGGTALVTDHTNASRTLLYNVNRHDWDEDLLELFGVPRASLPDIRSSGGVFGTADPKLLGAEIPIAGIAGDQQAALYGQGCWDPGQAKNTYGTGAFLLMVVGPERGTRQPARSGRPEVLTTVSCGPAGEPQYALEGSVFIAGAAVQWLRDGLGIIARAAETEALAAGEESTGGVYFVPALVGLGSPYWEADARGTIVGLTRGTTKAHLARSALEAMAYSTKDVAIAMTAASGVPLSELKADGGAAANDWLMQFQADTLGVRVGRPDIVETTALGAAGLAGLAVGVWDNPSAFLDVRHYAWFEPRQVPHHGFAGWKRAVETALFWAQQGGG